MLELIRRVGDAVLIGDDIRVVVVSISHGQAHIGIDAPKEVPVDRAEIRRLKESRELPRCPDCGYTKEDARLHGDHHLCGGSIPEAVKNAQ